MSDCVFAKINRDCIDLICLIFGKSGESNAVAWICSVLRQVLVIGTVFGRILRTKQWEKYSLLHDMSITVVYWILRDLFFKLLCMRISAVPRRRPNRRPFVQRQIRRAVWPRRHCWTESGHSRRACRRLPCSSYSRCSGWDPWRSTRDSTRQKSQLDYKMSPCTREC